LKLTCNSRPEKYELIKIILPVVLYECESWSLTLREEHILRVLEEKVMRIYGYNRKVEKNYTVRSFIILNLHPICLG
jgi:hypothetical protein